MNTTITAAVATERRNDLVAAANVDRIARSARSARKSWFTRKPRFSSAGHNSRYVNQYRQAEDRWQTLYGLAAVTGR